MLVNAELTHLSTLVIVTNADSALAGETLAPEATELDLSLRDALVGEQKPCTEDRLGKDIKDGVGDDLLIDTDLAGAVSNTPDAGKKKVSI